MRDSYTLRVLDDAGAPIAAASVDINESQVGTSAEDGTIVEWNRSSTVLEVSAAGHVPKTVTISERPDGAFEVVRSRRILRGRVLDPAGRLVESAVVGRPGFGDHGRRGEDKPRGAEPGSVEVSRPAWTPTSFEWDGGAGESVVELAPSVARAVHIAGEAAGEDIDHFFEMASSTELNALMLDLKDESGLVWYNSADPTADEVGALGAHTT